MERVLLHCDCDTFFASVECLYHPEIRDKPVAVGGDEESRHGIVLTKNAIAKQYGIKTGESLMEARKKCPGLITVKANMPLYLRFSRSFREILCQYSSAVESYGLDEGWLSLSSPGITIEDGARIADEIRQRTIDELGITCSVGVSYTKPFSKLGSDRRKPNGRTVISKENYKETVWPLPVSELLFVGPATTKVLYKYNILTIGDLANYDPEWIQYKLGKNGLLIQSFARGEDMSPVKPCDVQDPTKSVGNSSTLPRDATSIEDVKTVFAILADSVAHRMRESGFRARCVNIGARKNDLSWEGCQRAIRTPTCLASDLLHVAIELFRERRYDTLFPLRGLSLRCTQLSSAAEPLQTDLFDSAEKFAAKEALEKTVRSLQDRFGKKSIQLGVMMADAKLARVNPKDLHVAPAAPYHY